ncbi:hypothetical protein A2V82_11915 [candidate division KSB1 bacterium RBG_16_48_16]|nr:MAG: hypothetical protein A2V82_11915 [candidate division KSB1 bacterium RBG_16_48_16]
MKTNILVVALLTWITAVVLEPASAQNVSQTVGEAGQVDWSSQVIRSTGIGAPNPAMPITAQRSGAIEAAKRIALRNLLETVQGMSLTSEVTVRNAMIENDVINTRVNGIVRGFTIVDTKYMSTGDVEVTVEVPVTGALLDALLPQMVVPTPVGPSTPQAAVQTQQPTGVFTGLIVDARGMSVRPAMAPKILDQSGSELYGSRNVDRDWAVKIGMVGYDKDVTRAKANDRVTNNPLVLKAEKASGANKADVVLTNESATQLRDAAANQSFLNQCKVMFIVD